MKRILILYATTEGQTEKVANRIAAHLKNKGAAVQLVSAQNRAATNEIDIAAFDLLVFGASMHAGGLEKELVEFINRHNDQIEPKSRSFFLVLLSAATQDPALKAQSLQDAQNKMNKQLSVSFDHTEMIAGALMYSKYSLPTKWIMKRIAKKSGGDTDTSKDHEYTDWSQVQRYAETLYAS